MSNISDDEFDNIPDDFADVQDVDWATILGGPSTSTAPHASNTRPSNSEPRRPEQDTARPPNSRHASNNTTSYFSDDDGLDSNMLAELDRIEGSLTHSQSVAPAAASSSSPSTGTAPAATVTTGNASSSFSDRTDGASPPQPQIQIPELVHGNVNQVIVPTIVEPPKTPSRQTGKRQRLEAIEEAINSTPSKRLRPDMHTFVAPISPRSKGKMKCDDKLGEILNRYDEELMCPICCDLFVESHSGNPCGHTFCGDCGWKWYNNKAANQCCPCCRESLDPNLPMIPNLVVNNMVETHVRALASSGQDEWAPGGHKHKDWMVRKRIWRDGAKQREKQKRRKANSIMAVSHIVDLTDPPSYWMSVRDDPDEDPTYVNSDDVEQLPTRPIHRPARRRQRGHR